MDYDVTARLRKPMSDQSRTAYYVDSLSMFARGLEYEGVVSPTDMRRRAQQAIAAICIFEEEWQIAAMVNYETDIDYCEGWPL